jgi:signal transduction histidine kinase
LATTELSPELADAADVLSDQLRAQLERLSALLEPHASKLDRRFQTRLQQMSFTPAQRTALAAITFGSAARILASGQPALHFIEQVEYSGRRLAKLNLPPSAIVEALQEYDRLLAEQLRRLAAAELANFQWVREQLHFCVILTLNNAYYQVREAETQAFYELFRVELESRNLSELLRRFRETLLDVCQADAGHIYLLSEDGKQWIRFADGVDAPGPQRVPVRKSAGLSHARYIPCAEASPDLLLNPEWKTRYHSAWSVPLAQDGRLAGLMQFAFQEPYEWLPREQELLAAAAERCLMAADKARLMEDLAAREDQIRQLAEHMLHVEEMERRRISRELHDEAGQSLLCIRLQMELLEQALPERESETKSKLREARDLTERTILEMRRLIAALSPAVLEQLGLGAALRQLVMRFQRVHPGIQVKLGLHRLGGLPQKTEIIVYRLVQECFNNIAKHSGATRVNILVSSADGVLRLQVVDNGRGFNVEEAFARRDSFGLSGMRERVALLGGSFQIRSVPAPSKVERGRADRTPRLGVRPGKVAKSERGTKIWIELPISAERIVARHQLA